MRWLPRLAYAVFLLFLTEITAQVLVYVRTGWWQWQYRAGVNATLFQRNPFLVGVPRASARATDGTKVISIDESGFRNVPGQHRGDSAIRVLTLGGSTTFGVSVDDADTWQVHLSNALNRDATRPVTVINGGVPGYTSAENLVQFAFQAAEVRPHVVVLFQGINDLRATNSPDLRSDYSNFHAKAQVDNLATNELKVGNRIALLAIAKRVVEAVFVRDAYRAPAGPRAGTPDPQALGIFRHNLVTIGAMCRAYQVVCIFVPQVLSPVHTAEGPIQAWWLRYVEVDSLRPLLAAYNETLRGVAADAGLVYATSVADATWDGTSFLDYCHFSPAGNARFAELLAPYVQSAATRAVEVARGGTPLTSSARAPGP